MTGDELRTLYDYEYWANQQLMSVLAGLTEEEFTRVLAGGHASVRGALVHAMGRLRSSCARSAMRPATSTCSSTSSGSRSLVRASGWRNYRPPGALSLCQLVFYQSADLYFKAVSDSFSATEATAMKADIHPTYATATVKCACGNEFTTRSTQSEIHTDICGNCHPFYTGKQKLIDTAGRVERCRQKYGKPA